MCEYCVCWKYLCQIIHPWREVGCLWSKPRNWRLSWGCVGACPSSRPGTNKPNTSIILRLYDFFTQIKTFFSYPRVLSLTFWLAEFTNFCFVCKRQLVSNWHIFPPSNFPHKCLRCDSSEKSRNIQLRLVQSSLIATNIVGHRALDCCHTTRVVLEVVAVVLNQWKI